MEEPKEEKVTIPKSTLDSLVSKVEKQSEQIGMLLEVADKARVSRYEAAHKDLSQKKVRISTYDGKMVIGWKNLVDEMYQDEQGRFHEKQAIELYFIDNTKKVVTLKDFTRRTKKVEGLVLSNYTTPEGENMMKVDVMGKQIDIDIVFVN